MTAPQPVDKLYDLLKRILALIPGLTYKAASHNADRTQVHIDPRCGGLIERHWPEVFALCEECGCTARFEWTEGQVFRSVLDTASAAPIYTAEPVHTVRLLLQEAPRTREAA
jgi:hypothetical protein